MYQCFFDIIQLNFSFYNERSEATCEAGGGAKLVLLITRVSVYYAKNLSVHRSWFSKFERYSLLLSKNLEPNE